MKTITFFFFIAIIAHTASSSAMYFIRHNKNAQATEKCYCAIKDNNTKKVKKYIKQGANVNYVPETDNPFKQNFLQLALYKKSIPIIELLLGANAMNVNSHPTGSMPPLHYGVLSGNPVIVNLLLNHPTTNINITDHDGCICLFTAFDSISAHNRLIAKALLDRKIDITIPNQKGDTILHYVCKKASLDWVNLILTTDNPLLNTQDTYGDTPVHVACYMNAASIIQAMLSSKHCINLQLRNKNGHSVIDIAFYHKYDGILSLFFDKHFKELMSAYPKDQRIFDFAIRANKPTILEKILPSRHTNSSNQDGLTPLMIASEKGHSKILKLLLKEKKCKPLFKNQFDRIALHYAAEYGNLKCVKILCNYGALNQQDYLKNTPLHFASAHKHIEVIDYLIEKKAKPLIGNKKGFIPLVIIYKNNIQSNLKKTTLDYMIHARDKQQNTSFHMLTEIKNILYDSYDYDDLLNFLFVNHLDIYARNKKGETVFDKINTQYNISFVSSIMKQSFLRVSSDRLPCALFRQMLDIIAIKDVFPLILIFYYKLNIETIFAKICKKNINDDIMSHPTQRLKEFKANLSNNLCYFPLLFRSVEDFYQRQK